MPNLTAFAPDIWAAEYPVRYAGLDIFARMIVVRLTSGGLVLLSPGPLSPDLTAEIAALGPVTYIVAPGTFHHLHVPEAQAAFPEAQTWLCPGLEKKRPDLNYTGLLGDTPEPAWAEDLDQQVVQGRIISEVLFFHRASKVLIATDLVEHYGDMTPEGGWKLKLYWKLFRMWNRPRPAPEYTLFGTRDRRATAAALTRALGWDFDRILLQHGANIETGGKAAARDAWAKALKRG